MAIKLEFVPERSETLREQLASALRQAVLSGKLKPGERLVESQLATMMQVSRGPVREAIFQLVEEGLLEQIPYRGTIVRTLDLKDLTEIYSFRILIETFAFETVWDTVSFTRGLFGMKPNPDHIEKVLKSLSLWSKKDNRLITLSGGMKRRVLIAKALSHEPRILFLDEPTAGVDVSLRQDMWALVRSLRDTGVTIILTTHYIEEAEEMADRIGVINHGEIILVQEKSRLMQALGKKELILMLEAPLSAIPDELAGFHLRIGSQPQELVYTYDSQRNDISALLAAVERCGLQVRDLQTQQSSLEDIFVTLVGGKS